MPSTLGRNFNFCFTKFKNQMPSSQSSIHDQSHNNPFLNSNNSASLTLIKNYNSLFEFTLECEYDEESNCNDIPDISTVFASRRFFFSSPGRSNSIIDSSSSTTANISDASTSSSFVQQTNTDSGFTRIDSSTFKVEHPWSDALVEGCTAMSTSSLDPYLDFRQSMQEIVESCNLSDTKANWNSLHELLTCYLALNPKSTHKYIVSAFSDLIVSLMESKRCTEIATKYNLSLYGDGGRSRI